MEPHFSVIIPTYKRADKVQRAVDSVLSQNYEHVTSIIVNDSPSDDSYTSCKEKYINNPKIVYLINEKNQGVNFSRNRALDHAEENSWIVFLDDDDHLAPGALNMFASLINTHKKEHWFIANRATEAGTSLTKINKEGSNKNYALHFLLTKKYKGDATHCIRKNNIKNIYFPKTVPQGDEWLFFYELSTTTAFFYKNWNATLTDGYTDDGLNYRKRSSAQQLKTLWSLFKEGASRGLYIHPTFLAYIILRLIRVFVK